jgi:uncharacterized protein (TIGR02453 family)
MYSLEAPTLAKIRNYIDYNPQALHQLVAAPEFQQYLGEIKGERLKTAPKGFAKDHPEIHFLAMKGFYVAHSFEMEKVFEPEFAAYCAEICQVMYPLNLYLREAISKE